MLSTKPSKRPATPRTVTERAGSAVAELVRVHASVELLQSLDLVDVVPRLAELDPDVLPLPAVDVVLAGVVGREREPFVLVVAVEEVAEVPGAIADVDLGVRQVGDAEVVAARVLGDALRRVRRELHEADGARAGAGVGVELALGLDHRREQRRVEAVVRRVTPDDRRVAERIPEPRIPRRLRLLQIEEDSDRGDDHRTRDEPASQSERRSSSNTPATKSSSPSR